MIRGDIRSSHFLKIITGIDLTGPLVKTPRYTRRMDFIVLRSPLFRRYRIVKRKNLLFLSSPFLFTPYSGKNESYEEGI